MRQQARSAEAPSPRTGTAVWRRRSPGVRGSGAPSARLLAPLALAIVAMLIFAGAAFAAETRPYTGTSFGPDGVGGSRSFQIIQGITVDQASGEIYVFDAGVSTIFKFDANGAAADFSATGTNEIQKVNGTSGAENELAIAPSGSPGGTAGDIYFANNSTVKVFAPSGAEIGTLGEGETCGVAVNPAGHLFIGSYGSTVREYVPSANPPTNADLTATSSAELPGICNVAADGAGNVYATNYSGGAIAKLEGIADPTATLIEPGAPTLAVDPVTDHLFADRGNLVAEYNSSGTLLATFGAGQITPSLEENGSRGVAVNSAKDEAYVGTTRGKVAVFGKKVIVPNVEAEMATGVTGMQATLHGTVNPSGLPVLECKFEYGTTAALGSSKPCVGAIPTDNADHGVSASLTGLESGTNYYFRIVARNANGSSVASGPNFVTPESAVTEAATQINGTEATLNGVVSPENEAVTECLFEYGPTNAYGSSVPCVGATPTDEGQHPVTAQLTGLTSGATEYHFRLVFKRASGASKGGDRSFETSGAKVLSERSPVVEQTGATLEAAINPRGSSTTYRFEYGSTTSYGNSGPDESLGEVNEPVSVTETLTGLTPSTTYHWRVVAIDSFGEHPGEDRTFTTKGSSSSPETGCGNQTFRTDSPSANLPDCRAYEQASPTAKFGANIQHSQDNVYAADDGNGFTFGDANGLPTTGGSSRPTVYVALRGSDGWTTNGLRPLVENGAIAEITGWSEDLSTVLNTASGDTGNLFVGDTAARTWSVIAESPDPGTPITEANAAGFAANDPHHAIFEGAATFATGSVLKQNNLYEINNGDVTVASRVPVFPATSCDDAGGPACVLAPQGGFAGPYNWAQGENLNEYGGAKGGYYTPHILSDDGSRFSFTEVGTGRLYLREGDERTVQVSASQAATEDPNGHRPAAWVGQTPSGSRVYFLSCEKLTDDSTAVSTESSRCNEPEQFGGGYLQGQDLYEYNVDSGELTDLTVDENAGDPLGAGVVGFLGASTDGSYVYFVANGVLASGGTPTACSATGGNNCNIYVRHAGVTTLVAKTGKADNWLDVRPNGPDNSRTSRVSDNGVLMFVAPERLTSYDNEGKQEVYRYAGTSGLACVSCDPSGAAAVGDATLFSSGQSGGAYPRFKLLPRNLSADGNRVFFQSTDRLVSEDVNGVAGCSESKCQDVYMWEAKGAGSCQSTSQNGGCLYLVSTGNSPAPSYFGDASTSGDDAFIFTDQPLVPQDTDELVDAYDARVGGGLAAQHPVPPPPPCEGEACRGAGTVPPAVNGAGTAVFQGAANPAVTFKKCKKGKVLKKNKCVKKHKKKHHKQTQKKAGHGKKGGSK
ncbi:MAG: hypothetical protein H0X42_05665 [Solirubrobacterales bacterium]|nr:hypothetical protein [Solirubrobacterales bacterium]